MNKQTHKLFIYLFILCVQQKRIVEGKTPKKCLTLLRGFEEVEYFFKTRSHLLIFIPMFYIRFFFLVALIRSRSSLFIGQ